MRVQLDLDGCFFNYGDSLKRYMDSIGMGHLWKSGPTPTPFWNFFEDWGMPLDEFIKLNNDAADAGYLFTGPMREGGKEAWDRLVATGNTIVIATDRRFGSTPEVSEKNTMEWLEMHDLYYDELWFTHDKVLPRPDMACDDKVENFQHMYDEGVDVFLIDRPWNQGVSTNCRRIHDVQAFAREVEIKSHSMV